MIGSLLLSSTVLGLALGCLECYYYYYYKSMLLECHTVKKTLKHLTTKKIKSNSVTRLSQKSNEQLKSDVFSRRLKTYSDGEAVTSDGRLFQTRAAATPKLL